MRKYGTCFFERYAQISLETILGKEFAGLENKDSPDLQSPDGHTLGIEVTRAMEESKEAATSLLKEISGIVPTEDEKADYRNIIRSGYSFGLQNGRFIGARELDYWTNALPMQRILESKIAKATGGFYGKYDKLGLYIFSLDNLTQMGVYKICKFAMEQQMYAERGYDRIYLSEVSCLHVCNLSEGISDAARIVSFDIPQEQRKEIYLQALWEPFESIHNQ